MRLTLKQEIFLIIESAIERGLNPTRAFLRDFYGPSRRKVVLNTLKKMEDYGEIDKFEKEGEICYGLNVKGEVQIVSVRFFRLPIQPHKWDGKWRLVIFDIPENKRSLREQLRRKLVELSFGQL